MIAMIVMNCDRQEEGGEGEENSVTRKLGKLKKKS